MKAAMDERVTTLYFSSTSKRWREVCKMFKILTRIRKDETESPPLRFAESDWSKRAGRAPLPIALHSRLGCASSLSFLIRLRTI